METWAWLAAYLLGFALLQVYLYMYFMRGKSTTGSQGNSTADASRTESTPERGSPRFAETGSAVDLPEDLDSDDLVSCEACGMYNRNDRMFVFCANCGERLH